MKTQGFSQALALIVCIGVGLGVGASIRSGLNSPKSVGPASRFTNKGIQSSRLASISNDSQALASNGDIRDRAHANSHFLQKDWAGLERFLSEWAARDVYAALEWVLALEAPYRKEAMAHVLLSWFKTDAEEALKWCKDYDRDFLEDKRLYVSLVKDGRVEFALRALGSSKYSPFAANALYAEWAKIDLNAARTYLEKSNRKSSDKWILSALAVVSEWGLQDMAGALNWISRNAEGNAARLLIRDVVARAAKEGAGDAIEAAAKMMQPGPQRDGFYEALASFQATSNPSGAAEWLGQISDPNRRASDVVTVNEIAATRPDLAARLIEQLTKESTRNLRLKNLVIRWAKKDTMAALAYAQSSPGMSEVTRQEVIATIAPKR